MEEIDSPILARRRWKLHAHGKSIVIVKGTHERVTHPLMKAFLWALYLPQYPTNTVEIRIGDRYKPDVVALDPTQTRFRPNEPLFWGEAGQTARDKIQALVKRYPDTHFALAKWDMRLDRYVELVQDALDGVRRSAPFDVIVFPAGSERHINSDGDITITFADLEWMRLEA